MMSVTSIFSIVLLPLMLVFPWIMKKIGGMSKMVGVFAASVSLVTSLFSSPAQT